MKKYQYYVGIDVSKKWIDLALIHVNNGYCYTSKRFNSDEKGFRQLLKWVGQFDQSGGKNTLFCMENTGYYALKLCYFFTEQQLDYCLEAPVKIKRSLGLKRGKSDKLDAQHIAAYVYEKKNSLRLHTLPSRAIIDLKALLAFRLRLIKQKNALKTSSQELQDCTQKGTSEYVCTSSQDIIEVYNEKLKLLERQIMQLIKANKDIVANYKLATSVVGVGKVIAAYMIVYTCNFSNFTTWRKFACFSATAPFPYESGTSIKGKDHISNYGNKLMKTLLTNGAFSASRADKELNKFYHRKMGQGKEKMVVINIIRNKLISRIFATVRRGTPFVPMMNYA